MCICSDNIRFGPEIHPLVGIHVWLPSCLFQVIFCQITIIHQTFLSCITPPRRGFPPVMSLCTKCYLLVYDRGVPFIPGSRFSDLFQFTCLDTGSFMLRKNNVQQIFSFFHGFFQWVFEDQHTALCWSCAASDRHLLQHLCVQHRLNSLATFWNCGQCLHTCKYALMILLLHQLYSDPDCCKPSRFLPF